jgi:hypothetical protein
MCLQVLTPAPVKLDNSNFIPTVHLSRQLTLLWAKRTWKDTLEVLGVTEQDFQL